MKFDDFDRKMRTYEESLDQYILPDMYLVTRLDGRSFSKLTKDTCEFEVPFDKRFNDIMVATVKALMSESGFKILYGYTQSDEISLLFHPEDISFHHKVRKINTTLSSLASVAFYKEISKLFDIPGYTTFDCRTIPLPNKERVADYFEWRQLDATRNALNSWCYWTLRKDGFSKRAATSELNDKGNFFKNELLHTHGINFNDLPVWQRRGVGVSVKEVEREGYNPITKENVVTKRNVLKADYDIPMKEEYRKYILSFLEEE